MAHKILLSENEAKKQADKIMSRVQALMSQSAV
jgi:hypothetical protein